MGIALPRHSPKHENLDFHRRVLDQLPTPVIVISAKGNIMYTNMAMLELTGWQVDEAIGESLYRYLHPDDAPWVLNAFGNLIESAEANTSLGASGWLSLRIRVMASDGTVIPIEATGGAGLTDPAVGGFMYTARHALIEKLHDDVFAGVAAGDSLESLMKLVLEIVTLSPLEIDAAVFEQRGDGSTRLVAASDPAFEGLPAACGDMVPWAGLQTDTARVAIDALPAKARHHLVTAGFVDCFHGGAHAPDVSSTLRLVACSRVVREPAMGTLQRVERARELMSVVLLKAHNDRLLERSATLDDLTGLPNRLGLTRRLREIEISSDQYAMLFVDIDGFKRVNDLYGHAVGDRVLATVADRLRRAVRAGDVVTRLYGDEFVIVLNGSAVGVSAETAGRLADRVVQMLGEPVKIDDSTLTISASVGVAYLDETRDVERLVGCADEAMYLAKRAGGGTHRTAAPRAAHAGIVDDA